MLCSNSANGYLISFYINTLQFIRNGIRWGLIKFDWPQSDPVYVPADKKCLKRIPKMLPLTKSAPNGFRKWPRWQKVPQTDSENGPAEKKCPKRIPKMLPQGKSASNGFRKWPRWQKVPQTDSENGPAGKKCPKRIPFIYLPADFILAALLPRQPHE